MKNYLQLKEFILNKSHRAFRKSVKDDLAAEYALLRLSPEERMTRRFEWLTKQETPIVFENERIAFLRTVKNLPPIFTETEWAEIRSKYYIHELGYHSNISPNYEKIIEKGFLYYRETANEYGKRMIDALLALCDRYAAEAEKIGNLEVAENLKQVPRYGANSFLQALQAFRVIHFALWLEGNYHVTVGRFDKYMRPYYEKDIKDGKLTKAEAAVLVEEFFLSFNRDSDLYPGVQQGDNGQSLVLGGVDENGEEVFNELSELCLQASGNLMVIDPKINIRVGKNTPLRVYELGTKLTKKGLGFPQYTNDDIAIPALERLGYAPKDARNYAMAACWELIIPNVGMDIANIGALSFAKVIDVALKEHLRHCETLDVFLPVVRRLIWQEFEKIHAGLKNVWFIPSPLLRVCMDEKEGGRYAYNNFGIHGTGICTAADSLAAIEKYVFEEKSVSVETLIDAVEKDFDGYPELLHRLRYETPKVGQNDEFADKYLRFLLESFSDSLDYRRNDLDGTYRAGTGSAMYYLWHANEIGASPDGRRKGEPLGTNFSVSLFAKVGGPLSVIQSLTKPDFSRAMNGGPVTLEFASSIWNAEDCESKFARFVKTFIDMGGHQLQLNSVNLDTLKAAQKDPENYERLVVRIWGWSAYFTALDKEYQDHVMRRQEYHI